MTSPLNGITILDLTRVLSGPYCTMLLADMGARVIKVEQPRSGDDTRHWGPPFLGTESAYFLSINRNKESVTLDFKQPEGRAILDRLIAKSDVIVENFRPGALARLGLDYASLAPAHPRLVYCSISGFGQTGPRRKEPGYDAVLQAYGGLMSVNGEADGDPLRVGVPIVDLTAAHQAFAGVLLALLERATSSRGQLVDITLLDAVVSIMHPHSAAYLASGVVPVRTGAAHPTVTPYQVVRTAGEGRLFVAAASDTHFACLAEVLGVPALPQDPRFRRNRDRVVRRRELFAVLDPLFAAWDAGELAQALQERGVPAGPVNDVGAALAEPQVRHRDLVVADGGYQGVGVPIKLSRSAAAKVRAPSAAGADTDRVLAEHGYRPDEVAALRASGALGPVLTGRSRR